MKKILTLDKIYIGKSRIFNAGRGVFARRDIKKGEVIEYCPIIKISKYDTSILNESILVTYFFYFGEKKEKSAIILGFGSIYNHSENPNAVIKIIEKESVATFTAINNINKGDEITFNYRGDNLKSTKDPLWFEVK